MSPENFVFWLMGFLQENPCKKIDKDDNPLTHSGLSVHKYNEILKALSQIDFKK
jgi:hypothetical protein